jgi:hypothetical protein
MNDLFNIAINNDIELEDRYATIRIMRAMQRINPRDYRTLSKQNEWKRKNNLIKSVGRPRKII